MNGNIIFSYIQKRLNLLSVMSSLDCSQVSLCWVINFISLNKIRPEKMAGILLEHTQIDFLESQLLYFNWNFSEIWSQGPNWQYVCTDSGYGLMADMPLPEPMLAEISDACNTVPLCPKVNTWVMIFLYYWSMDNVMHNIIQYQSSRAALQFNSRDPAARCRQRGSSSFHRKNYR